MPVKNVILGQRVTKEKLQRAKELRRNMTPAEKMLWNELRGNKLGVHFRRHTAPAVGAGDKSLRDLSSISTVTKRDWSLKWMETSMIYNKQKMQGVKRFLMRWG